MRNSILLFILLFSCKFVFAQNILIEVVVNGNISHLDNLLNVNQMNNYTLSDLRILRNTIYAKYGYRFNSNDLTEHFSQFSWYESKSGDVSEQLTAIDWKNIKLINELEYFYFGDFYFYTLKIDHAFTFQQNGIYLLDNEFNLTPIYTNNTNTYWWASFYSYVQIEDFLIFHSTQGRELFYDYISGYTEDLGNNVFNIREIINIEITSQKSIIINLLKSYDGLIQKTINFDNERFSAEKVGTIISDKNHSEAIIRIEGRNTSVSSDGFGHPYILNTSNVFSMFGENVLLLLENNIDLRRWDNEHLDIQVVYNNIYNKYFIMVINYGIQYR